MLSSSIDKFTSKPSRRRSKVIVPPDVRMTNISVLHLYMYTVAVSGCLRGSGGKRKRAPVVCGGNKLEKVTTISP